MTKKNHEAAIAAIHEAATAAIAGLISAREVMEVAENYYEESVEGWNRAAAMDALDKASEAYAVAKRAWEDELIILIVAANRKVKK